MVKIEEAKSILFQLELPKGQQNDRSARTLLALLGLKEDASWNSCTNKALRIHDIIEFIKVNYEFEYKENSRESIRRQTIHQFEHAGIIERNKDNPSRPTNSGQTAYSITTEALKVFKKFNTDKWEDSLSNFKSKKSTLVEKYSSKRSIKKVPIIISGETLRFSAGEHNLLQKQIIEEFAPRFAKNSKVLYVGDTAQKDVFIKSDELERLGIPLTQHDKLPDIILYIEEKNWIFLIEAVTSHGPVSKKRYYELEKILKKSPCGKVYVSAFLNYKVFKKYIDEIAWETEIWIASEPEHMIHMDGEKFMGPYSK